VTECNGCGAELGPKAAGRPVSERARLIVLGLICAGLLALDAGVPAALFAALGGVAWVIARPR
jgi:hypothetical protein